MLAIELDKAGFASFKDDGSIKLRLLDSCLPSMFALHKYLVGKQPAFMLDLFVGDLHIAMNHLTIWQSLLHKAYLRKQRQSTTLNAAEEMGVISCANFERTCLLLLLSNLSAWNIFTGIL